MPRDSRRPPASAPDLPTPPPVIRPDPRVARALAEIVAESRDGRRRFGVATLRDELAARLPAGHPATHSPESAERAAYASAAILADEYGVRYKPRYPGDHRVSIHLILPTAQ